MTNHEQVMRRALEALEADNSKLWPSEKRTTAITSLRGALAEYDDEPTYCPTCGEEDGGTTCGIPDCALRVGEEPQTESITDAMMNLVDRLGSEYDQVDPRAWQHLLVYAPKTEPAQEAVFEIGFGWLEDAITYPRGTKLYAAPPQRKPLTEDQKLDLVTNWFSEDWAIKNALGLLDDYDTVRVREIGDQR